MCHPYIGRGASRLQRLTHLAFKEARQVWQKHWCGDGVFHLIKRAEGFDKLKMSEYLLSLGFNEKDAIAYDAKEANQNVGVAIPGTFFQEGGWVALQDACESVFDSLENCHKAWEVRATQISFVDGLWQVIDAKQQIVGRAKRIFLANGLGVKDIALSAGIDLPLRPVRGQLSKFSFEQGSSWDARKPQFGLSGNVYCLPPVKNADGSYDWQVGSSYDEDVSDLEVWESSHLENKELIKAMINSGAIDAELTVKGAFVGARCVAKDRLPVMGPIEGFPGLYVLTALGSRGVMWSSLACQMFTEHLAEEIRHSAFLDARFFAGARLTAAGLTEDLAGAFAPARFLAGASNSKPILPSA
jgi:tRNA 5-methylaminomethyl-2-thiouridine biosynthesis bifunctional protein